MLCGSTVDRALGILDNRGCVSVSVVCLGVLIVVCVSLQKDVRGSGCRSGLFCCFSGRGVPRSIEQVLPIRGVACRGLAMRGWNHRVGRDVGVALVIGQYFGLGCFAYGCKNGYMVPLWYTTLNLMHRKK